MCEREREREREILGGEGGEIGRQTDRQRYNLDVRRKV